MEMFPVVNSEFMVSQKLVNDIKMKLSLFMVSNDLLCVKFTNVRNVIGGKKELQTK